MDEIMFEECVGDRLAEQEWLLDCRVVARAIVRMPPPEEQRHRGELHGARVTRLRVRRWRKNDTVQK